MILRAFGLSARLRVQLGFLTKEARPTAIVKRHVAGSYFLSHPCD